MPPLARWLLRLAIVAAIVAVSVMGTIFVTALQPTPSVPLTADLSGAGDTASKEFNRRIVTRFPVGSSEAAMTTELRYEGFVRDDWSYANPDKDEALAVRRESIFPCANVAYVSWRASANGRLTAIRGDYGVEACL